MGRKTPRPSSLTARRDQRRLDRQESGGAYVGGLGSTALDCNRTADAAKCDLAGGWRLSLLHLRRTNRDRETPLMPKRILVLSASVGAGHLRAAQAVELALRELEPEAHVENHDVMEFTNGVF